MSWFGWNGGEARRAAEAEAARLKAWQAIRSRHLADAPAIELGVARADPDHEIVLTLTMDGKDRPYRLRRQVAASLIASLAVALSSAGVKAHQAPTGWAYPFSCCGNQDCREVPGSTVKALPGGYRAPSGEFLASNDRRLKPSPDGLYHWCSVQGLNDGKTLCLYVPPPAY